MHIEHINTELTLADLLTMNQTFKPNQTRICKKPSSQPSIWDLNTYILKYEYALQITITFKTKTIQKEIQQIMMIPMRNQQIKQLRGSPELGEIRLRTESWHKVVLLRGFCYPILGIC